MGLLDNPKIHSRELPPGLRGVYQLDRDGIARLACGALALRREVARPMLSAWRPIDPEDEATRVNKLRMAAEVVIAVLDMAAPHTDGPWSGSIDMELSGEAFRHDAPHEDEHRHQLASLPQPIKVLAGLPGEIIVAGS